MVHIFQSCYGLHGYPQIGSRDGLLEATLHMACALQKHLMGCTIHRYSQIYFESTSSLLHDSPTCGNYFWMRDFIVFC